MSLLSHWSPYFRAGVRIKGRAVQTSGKVVQLPPEQLQLIRAQVRDGQTHEVTVDAATGVACTCDRFADGAYCYHIWAALVDVHHNGPVAELDEGSIEQLSPKPPKASKRRGARKTTRQESVWMGRLNLLRPTTSRAAATDATALHVRQQLCYVIQARQSAQRGALVVELGQRHQTTSGWGRIRPFKIDVAAIARLENQQDRQIAVSLIGARPYDAEELDAVREPNCPVGSFELRHGGQRRLLQQMAKTQRCFIDDGDGLREPVQWDQTGDGSPWVLWLVGRKKRTELEVTLELRRDEQRMGIGDPSLLLDGPGGVVIADGRAAAFDDRGAPRWAGQFRGELRIEVDPSKMQIDVDEINGFLDRLYLLPNLPELDLPEDIRRGERTMQPLPHVELTNGKSPLTPHQLEANIWFDYGGCRVKPGQPGRFVVQGDVDAGDARSLIRRDDRFEDEAVAELATLGFRSQSTENGPVTVLASRHMGEAVQALVGHGWQVSAHQQLVRRAAAQNLAIKSGIDWFELHGGIRFDTTEGEQLVTVPEILEAARTGQQMVRLRDGSQGLLPAQWLWRHQLITAMGDVGEDHVKFKNTQAALLDALLETQELERVDQPFKEMRKRLVEFEKIKPIHESPMFAGELRPYQRDGLGWFHFLRWFGAGGVLADDMGLGKTVQVLALLDRQDETGEQPQDNEHKPTIVVAPRSVIFNWIDEANRFTPKLRVAAYMGSERKDLRQRFDEFDLLVTSYAVLRRDIDTLCVQEFDYIILDEAQAIKNPSSQSAKAARLLHGRQRLALTGTPVENHLGDLWSIFDFLNPGMLGAPGRFGKTVRSAAQDPFSKQSALQAANALRPFILRRTKKQVLSELPDKTEQTLVCEMGDEQRRIYDELLQHFRGALLGQVNTKKADQSAMPILEALLRLRQAACHPGLIDAARSDEPSAKLEVLSEQLAELIDEGHKVLVFSQFTSFLALVRNRLDKEGMTYAYLDGKTRDRKLPVERFQTDDKCPVFLISLKAGGLGLNLTAASYVYILDPWWNPAVEQQAIDRAHRIGQTRHVFAYRLVCEDTVEQRIIELQEKKKQLAEAIVGGESSLLKNLTREDLERLLT